MSSLDSPLPPLSVLRDEIKIAVRCVLLPQLKEACAAANLAKSGRKTDLQTRLVSQLAFVDQQIAARMLSALKGPDRLNQLVLASSFALQNSYSNMPLRFRESPFYTIDSNSVLCSNYLKPSPANRHQVNTLITWKPNQLEQLRSDSSLRVLLFCGERPSNAASTTVVDVSFPQNIELKINLDNVITEVKANFKGIKRKPGSTNPVDITALVKVREFKTPKLEIHFALTDKIYDIAVVIARRVPVDELIAKVKARRVISKEQVLQEMKSKAQDDEIVAGPTTMSLKDSVSFARISVPCRGLECRHYTCFDLGSYLEMQKQAPLWTCPVCDRKATFDSIAVDKYFEEMLQKAPPNVGSVTVQPNGEWSADAPTVEDDSDSNDEGDDGDDFIVISPPIGKKRESAPRASIGSHSGTHSATAANDAGPRGTKRHSEVIDLTLSSDDEGPRKPKRQHTGSRPPSIALPGTNSINSQHRMSIGGHSVANPMARTEERPYSFSMSRDTPTSTAFVPHSQLFGQQPLPALAPLHQSQRLQLPAFMGVGYSPVSGMMSLPSQSPSPFQGINGIIHTAPLPSPSHHAFVPSMPASRTWRPPPQSPSDSSSQSPGS